MHDLSIGSDPTHPLFGPAHKFSRAHQQLELLQAVVENASESPAAVVEPKYDAKRHERLYCIRMVRSLDPGVPLMVGEIVYNLRSGLDHLANLLVPEGKPRTTFPIAKNRSKFWRRDPKTGGFAQRSGGHKIRHMPGWARRLICEIQPYQRGDDAPSDPLWLLHELANYDKHHALFPLVSVAHDSALNLIVGPQRERRGVNVPGQKIFYGPIYDGKVVARIPLPETFTNDQMAMDFEMATLEAFAEPPAVRELDFVSVLRAVVVRVVEQVFIDRFDPHFR